ncbi:MAG: hypothetical protein HGB19_10915 [Chlorobiales bacterium]|nr:hypothetical protein [Chlorobiales bacterium]
MNECAGTVVIAFERVRIVDGIDRRGSSEEKNISNQILPTVWNQIEAAMAYVLGHPLLVIVENGARDEGLLEAGYDWYVQRVDLDPAIFAKKQFIGVFADWKRRVEDNARRQRKMDVANLTIGEIFTSMKPAQLWSLLGALAAIVAGAIAIGKHIP